MASSKSWFAPKRFGYGGGLPTAWQGWAVYLVALAAVGTAMTLLTGVARPIVVLSIVAVLIAVTRIKTEGGWRWRWGDAP